MMETHFPCSIPITCNNAQDLTVAQFCAKRYERETGEIASAIFTKSRVEWAVDCLQPFKSPGLDGIYPVMLQKNKNITVPILTEMFRASMTLAYIPNNWREVRVIFIPKAGKRDRTSPKSYRPISLTSVILKIMEKIVDLHIKLTYLTGKPLSKHQFAYQAGKSTETALHTLISKTEKSLESNEISLAAFLDIEGAFDNVSHSSINKAMQSHGFDSCIYNWIHAMLINRIITAKLGGSSLTTKPTKGCPQGGVLSPMLWSLVVDDLLNNLSAKGFEVIGFADDITILVRGKCDSTISNRMQSALNYTLKWCQLEGLSVNPTKTVVIPFTRKRKYKISILQLGGVQLELSKQTKYLGVMLDDKLNWNAHLEYVISKARNALWACSNTFGKKWGLKPRMIYWIYSAIVRPRITYASLVWWPKTAQISAQNKLCKLQRFACSSITGATASAPSKALDALLYILPLHQFIQLEAVKSAIRLKRVIPLQEGDLIGHLRILRDFQLNTLVTTNDDWMETKMDFNVPFEVIEPDRNIWEEGGPKIRPGSLVFYTDGSKMGKNTGAGITGPGINVSIPMGQWPTVFQAEIHAILTCTHICLTRKYRHANICIFSDSQAALMALKSYTSQSKLVWECIHSLKQLALANIVNLYWVPGHCGIAGNEKADTLARIGSSTGFIGPEPFCGVSTSCLNSELRNWESMMIETNWRAISTLRQSKRFITPCNRISRSLLTLKKDELSMLTGLLTGHCPSKYHLKKIGKLTDDTCRHCNLETETSEHLLCQCGALIQRRIRILGKGVLEPNEIWCTEPKKVINFIKELLPAWGEMPSQGATITNTNIDGTN